MKNHPSHSSGGEPNSDIVRLTRPGNSQPPEVHVILPSLRIEQVSHGGSTTLRVELADGNCVVVKVTTAAEWQNDDSEPAQSAFINEWSSGDGRQAG